MLQACFEEALVLIAELVGDGTDDRDTAAVMRYIGNVHLNGHSDFEAALAAHTSGLEMLQRIEGGDDASSVAIAAAVYSVAQVLECKGDYAQAQLWYKEALSKQRQFHGADAVHADIAASLHQVRVLTFFPRSWLSHVKRH